jgi:putative ABC transport system permease protein
VNPVRTLDILGLAISSLWQQKARTLLTTLGVVFGSFVLAASLSIGQGVQDTIERESHRSDILRKISVRPQWRGTESDLRPEDVEVKGQMSDAKRQRLRQALIDHKLRLGGNLPRAALTREKLRQLAAIEHVETVVPLVRLSGFAIFDNQDRRADMASARLEDAFARQRIVAGRYFDSPAERTVIVSEFLLYQWGLNDDVAVNSILGKKLRLEFRVGVHESGFGLYLIKPGGEMSREETAAIEKVRNQLPTALDKLDLTAAEKEVLRKATQGKPASAPALYAEEFIIVGVMRLQTAEEQQGPWDPLKADGDILLPQETATDLFFRVYGHSAAGVEEAILIVDREENVKEVHEQVTTMGLHSHAALNFIERQRLMYLMIFGAMTCVAAVALLVAALGIANTMLMSVLERTREIGIMKAVGAGNWHLQLIFLVEGALIGLLGGGLGLLLALVASYPADSWLRAMVSRDLKIELKEAIFVFPAWLALVVLLFAVVVTTLASVYPARRAAKVDPVAALRHE